MKDKTDRFLDIIDDMEMISDDELSEILDDRELREIQRAMSKTADALAETPDTDIDREWRKFSGKYLGHRHIGIFAGLSGFVSRNAAAVILGAVATIAVVAATIGVRNAFDYQTEVQPPVAEETGTEQPAGVAVADLTEDAPTVVAEHVVFRNRTLDTIIAEISEYYGVTAEYRNPEKKNMRLFFQWDQEQTLEETVGQLDSFEQIDIRLSDKVIVVE